MRTENLERGRAGGMMRLLVIVAVVAFVGLLVYGLLAKAPNTTINDALARDEAVSAPGFDLAVLSRGNPGRLADPWDRAAADGRVALGELRGTPVVLNLWASWCEPCRTEAPVLQGGWESARRRGVLFLGLDMQDVRDQARGFLAEFDQDFPNVRDPSNQTARRWGATGIPETFFISRRGRVVGHVVGTVSAEQLEQGIEATLSGRPIKPDFGGVQRPTR